MTLPKAKPFPFTKEYLRSILHYNKKTGIFTWKNTSSRSVQWNGRYAGTIAGSPNEQGYICIKIDKRLYKAHRLAWYYVYGKQPAEIDHEDTVKNHNWLDNLRPATSSENTHNTPAPITNTSGYKGVSKCAGKWKAQITIDGEKIYLGLYDYPEQASKVYIKAAKKYKGELARWA